MQTRVALECLASGSFRTVEYGLKIDYLFSQRSLSPSSLSLPSVTNASFPCMPSVRLAPSPSVLLAGRSRHVADGPEEQENLVLQYFALRTKPKGFSMVTSILKMAGGFLRPGLA